MEENNEMVEQQPEVHNESQESSQEVQTQTQHVDEHERNFRALREKAEKAERERDELAKKFKQYEDMLAQQQQQQQPQQQQQDPQSYDFSIGEDDLVEGKHLKTVAEQMKRLEAQIKGYEQQNQMTAAEQRLKRQYSDFDSVVSEANVNALKESHPEIAQVISNSGDLYSAGIAAYKFIKSIGIGQPDKYEKDISVAQQNASKPRPLASVSPQQGDTPLSHANAFAGGLTEEVKAKLRKEMDEAIKYR